MTSSPGGPWATALRRAGMAAAVCALLAACVVGPDFSPPPLPPAARGDAYTPSPLPSQTAAAAVAGGAAQQLAWGADMPAQWWSLFGSAALDQLVRAALANNPNMAAAEATLREARENYRAQAGSLLYPDVGLQLGATRAHGSALEGGSDAVYNLYNASVNVSYAPDVFGAARRTLEGARAGIDYQRFQREATYLALTANVVTTAIREASLRAQLQASTDVLDALRGQLGVLEQQLRFGAIARATVLTQRNQVALAAATLPPLEKALAQARHQLSVLAGRLPSEPGMPVFTLAALTLPRELPVSLPSALARQRPDVRASEQLLREASAQVGVATAKLYPQFTLSASYGGVGTTPGGLADGRNLVWNLLAGLTQPIFNGGALTARRRAAEAAYDAAAAQYRATLLGAFEDVADALRALDTDAAALQSQAEAEALASESLGLAGAQYKLGAINYLVLLDAQRVYQQSHVALAQAQAARYADTAALFQALGGGWWNRAGAPADGAADTSGGGGGISGGSGISSGSGSISGGSGISIGSIGINSSSPAPR